MYFIEWINELTCKNKNNIKNKKPKQNEEINPCVYKQPQKVQPENALVVVLLLLGNKY